MSDIVAIRLELSIADAKALKRLLETAPDMWPDVLSELGMLLPEFEDEDDASC